MSEPTTDIDFGIRPRIAPLVPFHPDDTRTLYEMIAHDLASSFGCDLRELALECTAHLASLAEGLDGPAPKPRVVVLHGPDPAQLLAITRATQHLLDVPGVIVPLASMSETGWSGRSLADEIDTMLTTRAMWAIWGVVALIGLESLRIRRGTYAKGSGGTTRDYRAGKAENVSALLNGLPVSGMSATWDARRAMIIVTTDDEASDLDSLVDSGLPRHLAHQLAAATWVGVSPGSLRGHEADVAARLSDVTELYARMGYDLTISPEAVRKAATVAANRGESSAIAAAWIRETARRQLLEMLAFGITRASASLGPEDVVPPDTSRGTWKE